jgi:hypothetical protein
VGETRGDTAHHTAALLFCVVRNRVLLLGKHELLRKYLVHHKDDISTSAVIEARECLLAFGTESFVFQFAIQKYKD